MTINIFKIRKIGIILTGIFAYNTIDTSTILVDKSNNMIEINSVNNLVNDRNLLILPEDRTKEIKEIREKELIFLKNLNIGYELAFDNISPRYDSTINKLNSKKIYPMEFLKETGMNPANYDLLNYCYMNNIKINSVSVNEYDLNFIKSNGITKEIRSKYKNINFNSEKYNVPNKYKSFYFLEDNIVGKLNKLNKLKKRIVLFVDINHFTGYKDKNNFFRSINKYNYMLFVPSDESFGDYKIVILDKVNFL